MCICLPNGKFNFKFQRTRITVSKKVDKCKPKLSLIPESGEEVENVDILPSDLFNKIHLSNSDNQGQMRQLSRDSQLPPVPDSLNFSLIQVNSPRKSTNKNNPHSTKMDQLRMNHQLDGSGYTCNSERDLHARCASECDASSRKQINNTTVLSPLDNKDKCDIYCTTVGNVNKPRSQVSKVNQFFEDAIDSGYLYSRIVKTDFSSLRKPVPPRSSIKDYSYQSLQSLDSRAPNVPDRSYNISEVAHCMAQTEFVDTNSKRQKDSSHSSKSNSLRRFSQPIFVTNDNDQLSQFSVESQRDFDVLRNLQSQYNTPPIKRASLADVCLLHATIDADLSQYSPGTIDDIPAANTNYCSKDCCDSAISSIPRNSASIIPHVYETLYEPLIYSPTDPGKNDPQISNYAPSTSSPSKIPYLGQDNYLSIRDNQLFTHPCSHNVVSTNEGSTVHSRDRSSIIYATTGSDVYAEISDGYPSRQYEELPDYRPTTKISANKCCPSSPSTLRVLLEIQSFRHMDSDVDVCSGSITTLCPLARPPVTTIIKSLQSSSSPHQDYCSSSSSTVTRHPWFVPPLQHSSFHDHHLTTVSKPKPSHNNLAVMTPLMERSMEDSTMSSREPPPNSLYDVLKTYRTDGTTRSGTHIYPAAFSNESDRCNNTDLWPRLP